MTKDKLASAISAVALIAGSGLFSPVSSFATSEIRMLESCDGIDDCAIVTSTAELKDAFAANKSTVLVGDSFELTDDARTGADMDLYLNNYTLTSDGWSIINSNGNLTIYAGEEGKIVETGGTYAPLYVYNNTVMKSGTIETAGQAVFVYYDGTTFIMDGGTISGGDDASTTILVGEGAKMIMNDGEINADTWGVSVFKDSEFEMNGGTINVSSEDGIGVSGNGSASGSNEGTNAKLTLNAGEINSGDLGVYAPQINGSTVLGEGLAINAGKCGVEIRAGELSVEGATINVDPEATYAFNPNGSGSTASGVGIAVAQHTTQRAISVNVSDGVFTAPVAFAEGNPQVNPEEAIEKVELSIVGGEFNATNGEPVVASEDVEKFISGGTFNKEPEERFIADGYVAALDFDNNLFKVVDPNNMEDPNEEVDTYIDEETGEEIDYIAPKQIDYAGDFIETDSEAEDQISAAVEFGDELIADRKATLSVTEEDTEGLVLTEEGELIGAFDINMLDREGQIIEVNDNDITIYIDLDEDTYNALAEYDELYAVYFNEDGEEEERFVVHLESDTYEDDVWYYLWFNTTHLSVYGILGVNADEPGDDPVVDPTDEPTEDAGAPDTGLMTTTGASAVSAGVTAAIATVILASIASLAYVIRKK